MVTARFSETLAFSNQSARRLNQNNIIGIITGMETLHLTSVVLIIFAVRIWNLNYFPVSSYNLQIILIIPLY
jgi:hypothetical protein